MVRVDQLFVGDVGLHPAIPVLVVRHDRGEDGDAGLEKGAAAEVGELPARELEGDRGRVVGLVEEGEGTDGDVPAEEGTVAEGEQAVVQGADGRGLSLAPGDGEYGGARKAEEDGDIRLDGTGGLEELVPLELDAGVLDDAVRLREVGELVPSQDQPDTGKAGEGGDRRGELGLGLAVGDGDLGAREGEEAGAREPAAVEPEAHDGDAETGEVGVGSEGRCVKTQRGTPFARAR